MTFEEWYKENIGDLPTEQNPTDYFCTGGASVIFMECWQAGRESVLSRVPSEAEWTPQRAMHACLEYCEPHIEQMWAARIVGYLLNCDFRDAKTNLAKLRDYTEKGG